MITRKRVQAALKKFGIRMAAKRVLKYVPIAGQAALSAAAMMYVGNAHIDECYEVARGAMEEQYAATRGVDPAPHSMAATP